MLCFGPLILMSNPLPHQCFDVHQMMPMRHECTHEVRVARIRTIVKALLRAQYQRPPRFKMVKLAIHLHDMHRPFGGDPRSTLDAAQMAEEKGIDHVIVGDHLIMTTSGAPKYPGALPVAVDYDQLEPITLLAAVGAVTKRIRLSAGIIIAPLRPAILLAKQVATLDVLTRGRVDLGMGVGWQSEEYAAAGVPWEGRFGRLEEQVQACRALWTQAPASFSGTTVEFSGAYSKPFPRQAGGPPIWFGLSLSDRNVMRIADLADGWIATTSRDHSAELVTNIQRLRSAFEARGRDPASLTVCLTVPASASSYSDLDFDSMLVEATSYVAAGVTILNYHPNRCCHTPVELDAFLGRLAALKDALNQR